MEKINDNTIFCGVMVLLSLIYIGLDLLKIYNNIPFTNKDCFFATLNIVLIIFWITSLKKTLNN